MSRRWPLLLGVALGLAAISLALATGGDAIEGWRLAARWTARVSFPLLLITYSASSLVRLWPLDATKAILRARRWWGLGFAAGHTLHLVALATFLRISGEVRPVALIVGGGVAYGLMYAMALTSNQRAMRALGKNWKRLHTAGIHWLWFGFAFAFFGRVLKGVEMPFSALAFAATLFALGLRIAAWRKTRRAAAFPTAAVT